MKKATGGLIFSLTIHNGFSWLPSSAISQAAVPTSPTEGQLNTVGQIGWLWFTVSISLSKKIFRPAPSPILSPIATPTSVDRAGLLKFERAPRG